MIVQQVNLDNFDWTVIMLYSVNKKDINNISKILQELNCPSDVILLIQDNLLYNKYDNGFTYTSYINRLSIIGIGEISENSELYNTLVHECYHLTEKLRKKLNWDEETSATFIGDFISKIYLSLIEMYNNL